MYHGAFETFKEYHYEKTNINHPHAYRRTNGVLWRIRGGGGNSKPQINWFSLAEKYPELVAEVDGLEACIAQAVGLWEALRKDGYAPAQEDLRIILEGEAKPGDNITSQAQTAIYYITDSAGYYEQLCKTNSPTSIVYTYAFYDLKNRDGAIPADAVSFSLKDEVILDPSTVVPELEKLAANNYRMKRSTTAGALDTANYCIGYLAPDTWGDIALTPGINCTTSPAIPF